MITLGDEVEDKITGFRGIAISRHIFLYGDPSINVQPVLEQYGILPEPETFLECQLTVTNPKKRGIDPKLHPIKVLQNKGK